MKKIITLMLALMLVMSMAVPAYAYDGNAGFNSWGNWWTGWFDFFPSVPTEPTVPEVPEMELGSTTMTEARFYHSGSVASLRNRLQLKWDAVENAEGYEVEVTKADGTVTCYASVSASLMVKNSACPKVYLETSNTWAAASVRVRAIAENAEGPWSEAVKISCDQVH